MPRPTQQEIDEFNARMNEPEGPDPDDFEIEIENPEGHRVRLPYARGKSYLAEHFGIDIGEPPASGGQAGVDNGNPDPESGNGAESGRPSQRYFPGKGTARK